jgi:DNA polymerase-3 subunit alpha
VGTHVHPPLVRRDKKTRRLATRNRPMRFRSLHHHSTYSYLDGFQLPEAHVRRATELNMDALAMTEHGNVSSHVKLEEAAIAAGIKPIFGVELYCGHVDEERRSQKKNHLTILAETQEGYSNMLKLVGETYSKGFYYEPTADGQMLRARRRGLVILSGCSGSLLFTSLVGGKHIDPADAGYRRGAGVARRMQRAFGDSYYLEVQAFPELESTRKANRLIARISRELKIPMVASMDCHYTIPTENEMQKVLHNVRGAGKQTLEEQARAWSYDVHLCPPATDREIINKLVATGLTRSEAQAAVLATEEIAGRCDVKIPSLPMLRYPLPADAATSRDLWRQWLKEGWSYRGLSRLPDRERREYKQRLKYEMDIIEGKDFVDYFLFVSDAVRWAKDHDIAVGPARGSAAGSLACWLLRITEINPMLYPNLVFERFIDASRADFPDIDLDFHSERRQEVTQYLIAKLGRESVNNIGTFTGYKGKNSLDDAARVYRIPKWEAEKIKDVLIERMPKDDRATQTIEDTIARSPDAADVIKRYPQLKVAMDLEGNIKGGGVHAAGLVISNGPIDDVCAVYERVVNGLLYKVVSLDKYDAEKKNLLKLDFLGLNTMTMLDEARKEIGMSLNDLYNLPLDDLGTISGFRANDVIGTFQLDGKICRYLCGALVPDTFMDICDIISIARPGPLNSGSATEYIEAAHGKKIELIHPALGPIVQSSRGQVIYQEQIMRICRDIGGMNAEQTNYVRRIIGKKLGNEEMNRQWDLFWQGVQREHPDMTKKQAKQIFDLCATAGTYAFNLAHAVSYGVIGWWGMWFKQHHMTVFYANALKYLSPGEKGKRHTALLRDAARHGLEIRPPRPRSGAHWRTRGENAIEAGLTQIPGIGEKVAASIIERRPTRWRDLADVKGIGAKTVDKVIEFTKGDDPLGAYWLDRSIGKVKLLIEEAGDGFDELPEPTHSAADLPYQDKTDIAVVWLGAVSGVVVRDIYEQFKLREGRDAKEGEIKDPHLREWVVMQGEDETDQISIRIDRWKYPKYKRLIWSITDKDLVLVRGVKPRWSANRQITVGDMWVIDPEDDE